MKKFVTILTLVLALCMVMPMAFAEEEETISFDYSEPIFVNNPDGTLVVKFKSTEPIGTDSDGNDTYEFQEWKVKKLDTTTAKTIGKKDTDKWEISEDPTCTKDATIALIPLDADGKPITEDTLLTNRTDGEDEETKQVSEKDKTVAGYSYYLYSSATTEITADQFLKLVKDSEYNKEVKKEVKAFGHSYKNGLVEVVKEATCTEKGKVIKVCDVCHEKSAVQETESLGHKSYIADDTTALTQLVKDGKYDYTDEKGKKYTYKLTSAPNCTNKGSYTGTCYVCGKEATFEISNKGYENVHKYGKWLTEKAATCEAKGMEYRLCTLCFAAKEERETDPLGHDFVAVDVEKAATCTENGLAKKLTCSRCKLEVTVKDGKWAIKNGDANKVSEELRTAGYEPDTEKNLVKLPIDPNNHPKEYWKLSSYADEGGKSIKPTCEKAGKLVYECIKDEELGLKGCGQIANEVKLPATGHDVKVSYFKKDADGNWVLIKAPTCELDKNGKTVEQVMFTYCCNTLKDADGKFDADKVTYEQITGIKEDKDVCAYKTKKENVKAPEHDWDKWVMRNAPDAETPGYWIRECKVCKAHDEYIGNTAPDVKTEDPKTEDPKTEDPKTEDKTADPTTEKTEDKTADPTVEKTEEKTADKTEEKTAEKTAEKTEDKTADKTEEKTAEKTEDKTADKTEEKTAEKTEDKTAEKTEDKTAEKTEEKTEEPKKNGIVKDNDGKYRAYKDGEVDTTVSGIVDYDGGKFIFANGVLQDVDGLWQDPATKEWGFYADGQFQDKTGFAEYDGYWFMLKDGKLDTTANGIYDYDGGKFVFAAGQLQKNLNGLWLDPATNEWVFVAGGQVQTQYTGVAEYNGEFFVLKDGKLDKKDGTVEYDGTTFIVSNGQLYPMPTEEAAA